MKASRKPKKPESSSVEKPAVRISSEIRSDIFRAFLLALVVLIVWCSIYNRWSVQSWQTPMTYLADPEKGDVVGTFAGIKAARDGHILPFLFTNIPELGAPYVANWDDYPTTEKPLVIMTGVLAKLTGVFAAVNLAFLIEYVLAALAFYAVCRMLKCAWTWAFSGALVFAFARFAFAHGIHHITVTYYWHLPLCLLVCGWIASGAGIGLRERRYLFAVAVALVTGVQNVYFTNIFCQFILFGGLLQCWRRQDWKAFLPAGGLIGTAAAAFLLMNANTFLYHAVYGPNSGAVVRVYKWLEIYALKIVDMLVPPPDHRWDVFAAWGGRHMKEVVLPFGELPPTGYLGLAGICALALLVAVSLRRVADREGAGEKVPVEAWQVVWILVYATVGGLNGFAGTLGFQLFRSTTRYSVVILCIALVFAVKRLSVLEFKKLPWLSGILAAAVAVIALWDQLPPQVTSGDLAQTAAQVESDRRFTQKIEEQLPANAMVFQIPIMEYPESPAPGVGSYDHFRPYLYSTRLRYSFGSDKGRLNTAWQRIISGLSFDEVVSKLESYGFAAVYVNRSGFQDKGESVVKAFKAMGRNTLIESERGDLFCVLLKPSATPSLPPTPAVN